VIRAGPGPPAHLAGLVRLIDAQTISGKIAKGVFEQMVSSGAPPDRLVAEQGLSQVTDTSAIDAAIAAVLEANADKVAEYRTGKGKLFGFFVGQGMKTRQARANPKLGKELLKQRRGKGAASRGEHGASLQGHHRDHRPHTARAAEPRHRRARRRDLRKV